MVKRKVARVFEECTGKYHICDDGLPHLDARGPGYDTKAQALRVAVHIGYTHAVGSGTYWEGIKRIPARFDDGSRSILAEGIDHESR